MSFSLVMPVYNEINSLQGLYDEICQVLNGDFELVFVDDGSTDGSYEFLLSLAEKDSKVRCLNLNSNHGQSWAIQEGIKVASKNKIVIMDSDSQYDPQDIPVLLSKLNSDVRLVSGKRDNRKDPFFYRKASSIGNYWIALFLGIPQFDLGCGLKAGYKRELIKLPYFRHIHRYYQIVYYYSGFNVLSVDIHHRPRKQGESKYSLMKIFNIIPRIVWLRVKKPILHA